MQSSRRSCSAWPQSHRIAACLSPTSLLFPNSAQKLANPPKPNFPKTINPRPGKDATRPVSTDGQQNELNDRQNTEQDTKLVKNRNNLNNELIGLMEEARCKAEKPQHLRTPASYLGAILQFC